MFALWYADNSSAYPCVGWEEEKRRVCPDEHDGDESPPPAEEVVPEFRLEDGDSPGSTQGEEREGVDTGFPMAYSNKYKENAVETESSLDPPNDANQVRQGVLRIPANQPRQATQLRSKTFPFSFSSFYSSYLARAIMASDIQSAAATVLLNVMKA